MALSKARTADSLDWTASGLVMKRKASLTLFGEIEEALEMLFTFDAVLNATRLKCKQCEKQDVKNTTASYRS
jgi:hypothetical protein